AAGPGRPAELRADPGWAARPAGPPDPELIRDGGASPQGGAAIPAKPRVTVGRALAVTYGPGMTSPSAPHPSPETLRLSSGELAAFLDTAFPAEARSKLGELLRVAPGHVRMGLDPDASMVRPGGIVSGPTLMGLIDVAAYAVVLAHIGPVEMAVTNTLSVSFL